MQSFIKPLVLVALSVAAAASFASIEIPAAQRIEITAPSQTAAAAAQSALTRGDDTTYQMSTGRRMVVTSLGDALQVSYGRRPVRVFKHDGNGSFVTADGRQVLRFELDAGGEPHHVRLSLPADMQ